MLNKTEILELIKAGENSRIEFKSVQFHSDSLIPEIITIVVDGKKILKVIIEKGRNKPYKVKTSNKFYIRAGSVSIEPTNEELVRLFQDGQQFHFEVSPLFRYSTKDFDLLGFRDYVANYRDLAFEEYEIDNLLYNLQCTDEQDRVSVVGALFFATNPSRFLPQSGIEMNAFDGVDTSANLIDYKSENCIVIKCIEQALSFIKKNSTTKVIFDSESGNRIERTDYEPFVIREIIVNAFMHRDWSIFGQRIRVNLFKNRVEVFSPGRLPNTLNLRRALSGISYYRNPIISQMLKDYKMADRVGRGLQSVVNHYKKNMLKEPLFEDETEYFRVILYNANL